MEFVLTTDRTVVPALAKQLAANFGPCEILPDGLLRIRFVYIEFCHSFAFVLIATRSGEEQVWIVNSRVEVSQETLILSGCARSSVG
jgi:hypothetical protein